MNPDQRTNLETMVEALVVNMAQAWSYFYVLKGINEGAKTQPAAVEPFYWLLDQLWRGMFDALFAKAGTLIDTTRNTYSLTNLVQLTRKYGDAELKRLIPHVEILLDSKTGTLAQIKNWRHEHGAHGTVRGNQDTFCIDNKLVLEDIERALMQLDEAINHLSCNVLSVHHDTNSAFEPLVAEGKRLFMAVANGVSRIDS